MFAERAEREGETMLLAVKGWLEREEAVSSCWLLVGEGGGRDRLLAREGGGCERLLAGEGSCEQLLWLEREVVNNY